MGFFSFAPSLPFQSDIVALFGLIRAPFAMVQALDKVVPESLPWKHTDEGPDDSVSHTKASLIGPSITIPITDGRLNVGTWQGIYLCEFRKLAHKRKIVATILP